MAGMTAHRQADECVDCGRIAANEIVDGHCVKIASCKRRQMRAAAGYAPDYRRDKMPAGVKASLERRTEWKRRVTRARKKRDDEQAKLTDAQAKLYAQIVESNDAGVPAVLISKIIGLSRSRVNQIMQAEHAVRGDYG